MRLSKLSVMSREGCLEMEYIRTFTSLAVIANALSDVKYDLIPIPGVASQFCWRLHQFELDKARSSPPQMVRHPDHRSLCPYPRQMRRPCAVQKFIASRMNNYSACF